ncbi:hypothetical protein [Rubritalea tangerina]|uniref:hypothetical protein n=1 Tax=Rubritalea tangerina TaxID=430798 RepID=UPI00361065B8
MFAKKAFIELSRNFVCVRLETYESEANQEMVRKHLNGKLANTAFVILSPDGERALCRGSRSPSMSFGARGEESLEKFSLRWAKLYQPIQREGEVLSYRIFIVLSKH